jgi:hypothetical protein
MATSHEDIIALAAAYKNLNDEERSLAAKWIEATESSEYYLGMIEALKITTRLPPINSNKVSIRMITILMTRAAHLLIKASGG